MHSPLAGFRILDLTNVLAGPFCCHQLVHLGAEVIKIEVPHRGDLARQLGADLELNENRMGVSFLAQNAGKKSLTIDLKKPRGKALLKQLVGTADVLIENFRPGVMDRLGVGYNDLLSDQPNLIYCAISGYGQCGPMRESPAYDQIVQGLSGAMSITGDEDTAPYRVGFPIADTVGGLNAALAVSAALAGRDRWQGGCFIDVSMLDSVLATMGWAVSNYLIADVEPRPLGNENATSSPSGTFATGSGLLNIAANKQEQFEALCRVIERPDLLEKPEFLDREHRKQHRGELKLELEKALAEVDAGTWEARLNAEGVPAGRVLTVPEALDLPQVRSRDMVQHFEMDINGRNRTIDVLRTGFHLGGEPVSASHGPATLGEHSRQLLSDLGLEKNEIDSLFDEGVI